MLKYRGSQLIRAGFIGVVLIILVIAVGLQPERLLSWATAVRYQALFSEAGGVPPSSTSVPVVISADLIAIGDQPGFSSFISAARPATCGLDIEVPLSKSNVRPL